MASFVNSPKNESQKDTFRLLSDIYHNTGDVVMEELWKLRINPGFLEQEGIRNDAEFFLPQIW